MKNNKKIVLVIAIVFIILIIGIISVRVYLENHYYYDDKEDYNEISYTTPKGLESGDYFDDYYSYYGDDISCSFSVNASDKYYNKDFKKWFENNIRVSLSDKVGEMKEISIGNTTGYYIDVQTDTRKEYYYGVESTNHYYLLEYNIYDDLNGDRPDLETNICYTAKDKIIESIKVK